MDLNTSLNISNFINYENKNSKNKFSEDIENLNNKSNIEFDYTNKIKENNILRRENDDLKNQINSLSKLQEKYLNKFNEGPNL